MEVYNDDVIRSKKTALFAEGGMAVLRGNLCPGGAVIKANAGSPDLLTHTGPACVFRDYDDLTARIDDPDLPVTADSVLILQNGGPVGGPGMPEWGMMAIPKKLLQQGVRDMVRISDSRMSGTSYGTCVLHVTPEAAVGGPLALVTDGDLIQLNVPARTLVCESSVLGCVHRTAIDSDFCAHRMCSSHRTKCSYVAKSGNHLSHKEVATMGGDGE